MKNPAEFLDIFLEQIKEAGLDISGLNLDHVAYQASSSSDYEEKLPEFKKISSYDHETIIAGRRVAVFELSEPIKYKNYIIPALELIEPKPDQNYESDFQHAEFVADKPLKDYIALYPSLNWDTSSLDREDFAHLKLHFDNGMTLKFLKKPILELIRAEEQK